jgi:hypothetical protein
MFKTFGLSVRREREGMVVMALIYGMKVYDKMGEFSSLSQHQPDSSVSSCAIFLYLATYLHRSS